MPELPEAQTIATQLDRCLRGARLGRVTVRRRNIIHTNGRNLQSVLPGLCVRCVSQRGKRVVVNLDGQASLVFRLGMTGQIIVAGADQPRDRHVHLRIAIDEAGRQPRELRFRDVRRFGGVWLTCGNGDRQAPDGPAIEPAGLENLGPEALTITPRQFDRLMSRRRQIKALLLDQQAIAGLGNIYCDEALHAARIHPLTRSSDLTAEQRRRLHRAIRRVLRDAIRAGGSTLRDYRTATGDEGSFQSRHRVYGQEGKPCHRCRTPIVRILAAGRSTHLCPNCQPIRQA